MGFCVNRPSWWTSHGWNCNITQSAWSNSLYSGSAVGTASRETKSKGTPTFKSDAKDTAVNMVGGTPATGNPLQGTNFLQQYKWGSDISAKWTAGENSTEKGAVYEGEG